ncbi:MAG: hypothetical protein ACF8R7_01690 [Phycisphaerales bacterium JB039]
MLGAWLAGAALLGGCAGDGLGGPRLEPTEARIDVIPGRTLVAPVRVTGDPAPLAPAQMDDGRIVPVALHWLEVRPSPGPAPAWLDDPGVWRALEPEDPGAGAGFWVITAEIQPGAAGQGLWLEGRRIALNWLGAEPSDPTPDAIFVPPPWPDISLRAGRRSQLTWFEPEARSPLTRWRFRLISRGLGGSAAMAPADTFADAPVEALARQFEDRWAIALDRLRLDDPQLADRFVRRLAAAIDFGPAVAPAFEPERADLTHLLADLLNPRLDADDRALRVGLWLQTLDSARAWVIDDVGAGASPSGPTFAIVGLASLSPDERIGWAADARTPGASDPIAIAPFSAEAVAAVAVEEQARAEGGLRELEVVIGERRAVVRAQDGALAVRPPGLRLAPMLHDWTLASWRSGAPTAAPSRAPGATGALLRQVRRADGQRIWTVYLEARAPARDGGVREQGRLWFGPRGAPLAVVELDPVAGRIRLREGGGAAAGAITREAERWVAEVEIDPAWIEADGRLRLGFERIDSAGRRVAWPRPMLPWQTEPGRALIDLKGWGSLSAGVR